MKFWTTQGEEVLKVILENNIYKPDFKLSNGLGSKNMKLAYDGLLCEYKLRNNLSCDGLVFGISKLEDIHINNINEYREYFLKNNMFWSSVSNAGEHYSILELEISDELDLIPMYFQDFIILGMRSIKDKSFFYYVKEKLRNEEFHNFSDDLKIAQNEVWTNDTEDMLNKIVQVHVHEILLDNIVDIHSTINFETNEAYELNKTSLKLKEMIGNKK